MFDYLNNREVSNAFRHFAILFLLVFYFFFAVVMLYIKPRNLLDWCWTWKMWSFVLILGAAALRGESEPLMPIIEILIWSNLILCLFITFIVFIQMEYNKRGR